MSLVDAAREMVAEVQKDPGHRCDFCAKRCSEVKGIVTSDQGTPTICNECVGLAVEILTKAGRYP